jgi:hypothetical protein
MSQPSRPTDRYGDHGRKLSRPLRIALAVTGIGLAVALVAWLAISATDQPVHWQDVAYTVRADGTVLFTFDVSMTPGRSAVCTVRALSPSSAEVGRRDVRVGPSSRQVIRATAVIRTSERAVSAQVKACAPAGG